MTSYLINYDGPRKKTTWQKPFAQFTNKNTRISSIIFIDLETENQEDIYHFTLSMNCTHLIYNLISIHACKIEYCSSENLNKVVKLHLLMSVDCNHLILLAAEGNIAMINEILRDTRFSFYFSYYIYMLHSKSFTLFYYYLFFHFLLQTLIYLSPNSNFFSDKL